MATGTGRRCPRALSDSTTVAIVGGGASGVLTAVHLLGRTTDPGLRVTVYEGSGRVARGIAYGTDDDRHLLNVRARDMSAFPDDPGHLLAWLARTGRAVDPDQFLPRTEYSRYLADALATVATSRLDVRASVVEDIVAEPDGFAIHTGAAIGRAGSVVLAYGNLAPRSLGFGGGDVVDAVWHLPNPWDLDRLRALPLDATVVVVGTGLSSVDTAVTLLGDSPSRHVIMTSRHGLLPRPHRAQLSTAWVSPIPSGPLTADQLAAVVRGQVEAAGRVGVDWRAVVDGLRTRTQSLWTRLDLGERQRFLDLYAREWEVHRHRMAPQIAARLDGWRRDGRLTVLAGGVESVVAQGDRCLVTFAGSAPQQPAPRPVTADAIVNSTGPMTDVSQSRNPLLRALVLRGMVTPDPLGLGLSCTPDGQVVDAAGLGTAGLYAVGPPRKGALYESTAVPEIREQAAEVARLIVDESRPQTTASAVASG